MHGAKMINVEGFYFQTQAKPGFAWSWIGAKLSEQINGMIIIHKRYFHASGIASRWIHFLSNKN